MQTIEEIRRLKIAQLIREAGSQAALSDRIDKAPAQISQWLNASTNSKTGKPRAISSAIARELEEKTGKPNGWFDSPEPTKDGALTYMITNEWVRAARKYANLTQDQLAEKMSTTKGNVSGWENSRHKPSFQQMKQISALTGFPLPLDGAPQPLAPNAAGAAAPTLAQALEVVATQLNRLTDEEREIVAQRLQTLTMAPDSLKAREAVLSKLAPSVKEAADAHQHTNANHIRKAA